MVLHVQKVGMLLNLLDVKVLQVPVRRRQRDTNTISATSDLESRLELLEESWEILEILISAAAVLGSRILPVKINTVEVIRGEEPNDRLDELVAVRVTSRDVAKYRCRRAGIIKRPAADGNKDFEVGVKFLESRETTEQALVQAGSKLQLEGVGVDRGKGKIEMSVNTKGNLLWVESIAWSCRGPGFVIANYALHASTAQRVD